MDRYAFMTVLLQFCDARRSDDPVRNARWASRERTAVEQVRLRRSLAYKPNLHSDPNRQPCWQAAEKSPDRRHSGAGAQRRNPEPMNTGLRNKSLTCVLGFRVRP